MTYKKSSKSLFKFGLVLLTLACLFWLSLLVIPFLPVSSAVKASLVILALVAGEVLFWLGAVCTGKELVQKYKSYLNPKNWQNTNK